VARQFFGAVAKVRDRIRRKKRRMPSAAFLEAVRLRACEFANNTPTMWNDLAQAWEDAGETAADAKLWTDAGIESPAVKNLIDQRGITPADVTLIREFLRPLPSLKDAVAAIAMLKALSEQGFVPVGAQKVAILTAFFDKLSDSDVSLSADPVSAGGSAPK